MPIVLKSILFGKYDLPIVHFRYYSKKKVNQIEIQEVGLSTPVTAFNFRYKFIIPLQKQIFV